MFAQAGVRRLTPPGRPNRHQWNTLLGLGLECVCSRRVGRAIEPMKPAQTAWTDSERVVEYILGFVACETAVSCAFEPRLSFPQVSEETLESPLGGSGMNA